MAVYEQEVPILGGGKCCSCELGQTSPRVSSRFDWIAVRGVGAIGPDAKEAVPALIETLQDDDRQIRWSAYRRHRQHRP